MKRVVLSIISVSFYIFSFAQVPESFNYQAIVRDGGATVSEQSVYYRFSIIKGELPGEVVYTEKHNPVTSVIGLVTLAIGKGTDKSGVFTAIDWGADIYSLNVELDIEGDGSYTDMGTTQLLSVPYALHAKTSETSVDAVKLTGNQTIDGDKTFTGIITGAVNANNTVVTNVATPVDPTDAVNKAYVDELKSQIEELQIQNGIEDIDANIYKIVKIGTQMWMKENLKTSKYNDGTDIPNLTDNTAWAALTTGAYSDYDNNSAYSTQYGRLYNWYAVDNNAATKVASNGGKNVCPTGWHIPSDAEWTTLTDYLINTGFGYEGSGVDIGKSMADTSGWTTDPTAGNVGNDQASNNRSDFTALPSGFRDLDGLFYSIGDYGYWWSSTEYSTTTAYDRNISYSYNSVHSYYNSKKDGFSVRCLRD